MTALELIQKVSELSPPGEWRVDELEHIRSRDGYCPVCWLAAQLGGNPEGHLTAWTEVKYELGLSFDEGAKVVRAADHSWYNLRLKLIAACGLGDTPPKKEEA